MDNYIERAFPFTFVEENKIGRPTETIVNQGMTLLDYFAAKAMQAMLSDVNSTAHDSYDKCAEWSYRQAEAMMKEKEKHK